MIRDRFGEAGRRASTRDGDAGFTLVEMVIAVVAVLVMAGAALIAVPGIISQARQASCDAMAGSIADAITASYAHYQDYSHAGGSGLVTDGYLVDVPDSDYFEIGTPSESAVTVEVGSACSGEFVPRMWAGQLVDGGYKFGVAGDDDEPVEASCADGGVCEVGDTGPGGGTVIYVAPSAQSWGTYIEAADPAAVAANSKTWGCYGIDVSSAAGTGLGEGKTNTAGILNLQSTCDGVSWSPQAAIYADGYTGTDGSTSGWYLPSKDELNLVCLLANGASTLQIRNQVACGTLGSFSASGNYWSSSQSDNTNAWYQGFGNGNQAPTTKSYSVGSVWPVRAF